MKTLEDFIQELMRVRKVDNRFDLDPEHWQTIAQRYAAYMWEQGAIAQRIECVKSWEDSPDGYHCEKHSIEEAPLAPFSNSTK